MVHTMLLASNCIPVPSPRFPHISLCSDQGLHCDVVFGSPSADCRGTGICKITGTNGLTVLDQKKECRRTQAILVERPDHSGVSLIFFRSKLCVQLYRRHFWKGILKMDESCAIPAEMQANLRQPFQQILPGQYPVIEENGYFRVDLNCSH